MSTEKPKGDDFGGYGPYAYVWNCTGQFINIESTQTNISGPTVNGIQNVVFYLDHMAFNNYIPIQNDSDMFKTGLFAQLSGYTSLEQHPLESGSIVINSSSGALEFQSGGSCQGSAEKPAGIKPKRTTRKA